MKKQTFEDYLREWHSKVNIGIEDSLPDSFDDWVGALKQNTLVSLADAYGAKCKLEGFKDATSIITALKII